MAIITEGEAKLEVHEAEVVSRKLPVFYNPRMKLNRDLSVLFLKAQARKLNIALPLSGSGARGIRMLLECPENVVSVHFNDHGPESAKLIRKNLSLNKLEADVHEEDANLFILNSTGFDYIDIDPFGSPNPFLDAAVKRISRKGVIAVTATDISGLAGSHPKACRRKYWATPLKNEFMHESAVRILIRKAQLIGSQYQRALMPVLCYAQEHYARVFFICRKGKQQTDKILDQHGFILYCPKCLERKTSRENAGTCSCGQPFTAIGPLWLGGLWDTNLLKEMIAYNTAPDLHPLLDQLCHESLAGQTGFYDLHLVAKKHGLAQLPKTDAVLERLSNAGYKACTTHFSPRGIRTDASIQHLLELLNQ